MCDQSAKGAALLLYGHPFLCRKESPFATHYTVVTKQQKEKKTDLLIFFRQNGERNNLQKMLEVGSILPRRNRLLLCACYWNNLHCASDYNKSYCRFSSRDQNGFFHF